MLYVSRNIQEWGGKMFRLRFLNQGVELDWIFKKNNKVYRNLKDLSKILSRVREWRLDMVQGSGWRKIKPLSFVPPSNSAQVINCPGQKKNYFSQNWEHTLHLIL